MPPQTKKHFGGSHIALTIDTNGYAQTSFLKAAEGGMIKAATTEEPAAGFNLRGRHASTREVDPLSLEFGMAGSKWALAIVHAIINNRIHDKVNGEVIHADTNFVAQYSYEFTDALITEIGFPKLDAKAKEIAHLKLKLQPESIDFAIGQGEKLVPGSALKQKGWLCSAFKLTIGDDVMASSIEPLTVKIGAKAYQTGGFMLPQYTPTGKLDMPKFSFTVPMGYADAMLAWFRAAITTHQGLTDGSPVGGGQFEKDAIIEFLDPTRKKTLYTINLLGIGPETCSVVKGDDSSTRAMKFDCYVTNIKVEATGEGFI